MQMKANCQTPMEHNLKILKVDYLSNHLMDPTQILNLSLDYQTILYKSFKWRRPPMKDDLNKLKVEYPNNQLLDHTQMLSLSSDEQTLFFKSSKWRRPPMENNLKILKVYHCMDHELWVLRGKLEENSEEILSVVLLSPAYFFWLSKGWL